MTSRLPKDRALVRGPWGCPGPTFSQRGMGIPPPEPAASSGSTGPDPALTARGQEGWPRDALHRRGGHSASTFSKEGRSSRSLPSAGLRPAGRVAWEALGATPSGAHPSQSHPLLLASVGLEGLRSAPSGKSRLLLLLGSPLPSKSPGEPRADEGGHTGAAAPEAPLLRAAGLPDVRSGAPAGLAPGNGDRGRFCAHETALGASPFDCPARLPSPPPLLRQASPQQDARFCAHLARPSTGLGTAPRDPPGSHGSHGLWSNRSPLEEDPGSSWTSEGLRGGGVAPHKHAPSLSS